MWLYNCAALKYTLEVTETESSVKTPRLFSCVKTLRLGFSHDLWSRNRKLRLLFVLLVYHIPEIDRTLLHAKSLIPFGLLFHFSLKLSSSFSLSPSLVSCPRYFSPLSYVHACPLSLSLVSSALIIFFLAPFQKDIFWSVSFSSWKSWDPLHSFRFKILLC